MSVRFRSTIETQPAALFAWHERPGAIVRLMPPWQRSRVLHEAESLRDGRVVIRLPLGLRVSAHHDPRSYVADEQFADRIGPPGAWRHIHRFEPSGSDATEMIDLVHTPIPGMALRRSFTYRHHQLSDDIAAMTRAEAVSGRRLTVAITGSTGLIGSQLSALLTTSGHRVIHLRRTSSSRPDERQWNPQDPAGDLLDGVDSVVHLAGASISGRFTAAHKHAVRDSRIEPTRRLAQLAAASGVESFIAASAIGYYGADRSGELLTEQSERGDGFLADVVAEWEAAAAEAAGATRVVNLRTGIVLSPAGGALALLRPLFMLGLGGRLGDGNQMMSWIGLDDVIDIYRLAIIDQQLSGPINAVAPQPVSNAEFTRTLARTLRRPALLPVPGFGPALLLGREGADEVAMADQNVAPTALVARDHVYRHPDLAAALAHMLGRRRDSREAR